MDAGARRKVRQHRQQTRRLFLLSKHGEVSRTMWIIFSIFLVLLLLGIEFYVPPVLLFLFFIGVVVTVAFALTPSQRQMTK